MWLLMQYKFGGVEGEVVAEFLNVHVLYTFSFFDNIVQHISSISTSYSIVHLTFKSAGTSHIS